MDPSNLPLFAMILFYFRTAEFMNAWQSLIASLSKFSILFLVHCAHGSGCKILLYAFQVCWICSLQSSFRFRVVANTKRLTKLVLMLGMSKSSLARSNSSIFWREMLESVTDNTAVYLVNNLKRAIPSLCSGCSQLA